MRKRRDTDDELNQLFVVDRVGILKGLLPRKTLILNDPDVRVGAVRETAEVSFLRQYVSHAKVVGRPGADIRD
ncbi:MAG: hypothetical protein ACREXR_16940 [Gammaproteobacteria bacterium]